MHKESQELKFLHEELGSLRKTFRKKECLHPDAPLGCSGGIVKAHTIAKSGGLLRIAENGHVLAPDLERDPTTIHAVGVNRASTFSGFCKLHDDKLFAPIEKEPLRLNRRHAFLLSFRSVSRELYLKRRTSEHPVADHAPFPDAWRYYQAGADSVVPHLESLYANMGSAYVRGRTRESKFYAVEFDIIPQILCSGTRNVEFDFHGVHLQRLLRRRPLEYITLSLLPYDGNRGVAVFSWFGKSTVNTQFVRSLSLLPVDEVPDAIVRFAFQHIENIYLNPSWWHQLADTDKNRLLQRFDSTYWRIDTDFIDLRPDGTRLVDWKVVGKPKTNVKL